MTWGMVAGAGASLIGGAMASDAAGDAADAQAGATQAGIAEQRRQSSQTRADYAPYREVGYGALERLTGRNTMPVRSRETFDAGAYMRANPDVLAAGLDAYSHYQNNGEGEGRPFQWTQEAQAQRARGPGSGVGEMDRPVTAENVMEDPGYAFGMQQGQQALDRKAAAGGGRVSGAALKAASEYATNYATTGYNAAYQRRQDRLNRLAALANIGQTATGSSAAAGASASNAIGGMMGAQGNASGAAALAQSNIWGNAANQLGAIGQRWASQPRSDAGWSAMPNQTAANNSSTGTAGYDYMTNDGYA